MVTTANNNIVQKMLEFIGNEKTDDIPANIVATWVQGYQDRNKMFSVREIHNVLGFNFTKLSKFKAQLIKRDGLVLPILETGRKNDHLTGG